MKNYKFASLILTTALAFCLSIGIAYADNLPEETPPVSSVVETNADSSSEQNAETAPTPDAEQKNSPNPDVQKSDTNTENVSKNTNTEKTEKHLNRGIVLNIVMIVLICILLGGEIYLFVCLKCLKKKSKYELPEDINERIDYIEQKCNKIGNIARNSNVGNSTSDKEIAERYIASVNEIYKRVDSIEDKVIQNRSDIGNIAVELSIMRSASLNKAKNNYSDNAEINHEMHFDNKAEQAPGRIFKNCGLVYKEGGVEIVEGKYMQYSEEADGSVLVNVTEAALDNSFRMSAKAFFDFVVSGNSQVITEQPCILKKSSAGGYFLTQKGRVTIA